MNILIVHNKYQIPGGEDVVVENEAAMLRKHGHKVVLYIRNNSELSEGGKLKKSLMYMESFFSVRVYRDICRLIRREKIEVVHVHNTVHRISPSVFYAAVHMGVPVVQTLHNFRMICPGATLYRDGHICEECVRGSYACRHYVAGSCLCGENSDSLEHSCCRCGCGKANKKSVRKASVRNYRRHTGYCYLPAIQHACYRGSRLQTAAVVLSSELQKISGIWGKVHYICLTDFNKEKLQSLNSGSKRTLIPSSHIYVKPNFTPDLLKSCNNRMSSDILNSCEEEHAAENSHFAVSKCSGKNLYSDIDNCPAEFSGDRLDELLCSIGLSKDTKYYLSLGRLEHIKGTHTIVKAFAHNGKTLVMAGTGEQEEAIRKYLEKHHITNIHLAGQLSHGDAMKLLSKAEALVICPQWYETFGMNVIEAYSLGIPVVSNDIGNAASLVVDGLTGAKGESSVRGLCKAVERFEIMDRHKLSENSRREYEKKYSEEKNYAVLMEIYDKMIDRMKMIMHGAYCKEERVEK
ncbi:MAG: glycosyltransferase [Lachnospiraceae bacterium]|nr:glycosyltransferase [Lachnospiraceae bacterium]